VSEWELMLDLTMKRRGCDRAEAEVILDRVADRLAGFTHEEVAVRHPLPTDGRVSWDDGDDA
jgi:hypothetical protein